MSVVGYGILEKKTLWLELLFCFIILLFVLTFYFPSCSSGFLFFTIYFTFIWVEASHYSD